MYAGECMWIRSSVTQTHMHCTACSPRAEGSDELKTCDELLFQVDSVQQQIRAAPVDADLRFDRKYVYYMFIFHHKVVYAMLKTRRVASTSIAS